LLPSKPGSSPENDETPTIASSERVLFALTAKTAVLLGCVAEASNCPAAMRASGLMSRERKHSVWIKSAIALRKRAASRRSTMSAILPFQKQIFLIGNKDKTLKCNQQGRHLFFFGKQRNEEHQHNAEKTELKERLLELRYFLGLNLRDKVCL
jgi:hypothetical protein